MKKVVFIIAITMLMIACKKNYICTCITSENTGTIPPVTVSHNINVKESKSEASCNSKNSVDVNFTTVCQLN